MARQEAVYRHPQSSRLPGGCFISLQTVQTASSFHSVAVASASPGLLRRASLLLQLDPVLMKGPRSVRAVNTQQVAPRNRHSHRFMFLRLFGTRLTGDGLVIYPDQFFEELLAIFLFVG